MYWVLFTSLQVLNQGETRPNLRGCAAAICGKSYSFPLFNLKLDLRVQNPKHTQVIDLSDGYIYSETGSRMGRRHTTSSSTVCCRMLWKRPNVSWTSWCFPDELFNGKMQSIITNKKMNYCQPHQVMKHGHRLAWLQVQFLLFCVFPLLF